LKDILVSRKFWALVLGLLVLFMGSLFPSFNLDEEAAVGLIVIVAAYIVGVAVDPGPGGWRGVLLSRKFWAAAVGLGFVFLQAFGIELPDPVTPDLLQWLCISIGAYIAGIAFEVPKFPR